MLTVAVLGPVEVRRDGEQLQLPGREVHRGPGAARAGCRPIDPRRPDPRRPLGHIYFRRREPLGQIYDSKWVNKPSIQNNSSEYLSSVVIKYGHDWDKDVYNYQYEYTGALKESAHNTYKKYKNDSFETNLIDSTSAAGKALDIMQQSYKIGDIVNRTMTANDGTTDYASTLEITDFIIAQPKKRSTNTQYGDMSFQYLNETLEVYELMGITKNPEKNELKLSMRYVKDYEEA